LFPISDQIRARHRFPYVNVALIAINAIVFLFEISLNSLDQTAFFYRLGLIPRELTGGVAFECLVGTSTGIEATFGDVCDRLIAQGTPDITTPFHTWGTVFTSMFIHGGMLHIAGNLVFLWVFGDNVEDRLGHFKYLVFYLATGVAAGWTQIAINMDSDVPTIGASGAIAGVLGAYLLLYPYNQIRTVIIFFFITFVRLPAMAVLGFWIILQFFSGIFALVPSVTSGVAYWAHIGGFVAGMATIALLRLFIWHEPIWPGRPRPFGDWSQGPLDFPR
jgi:membrane associated rhomboid family serine protease